MWIFSATVKKYLRDAKAFMCFSDGEVITKELVVVKSYKPKKNGSARSKIKIRRAAIVKPVQLYVLSFSA